MDEIDCFPFRAYELEDDGRVYNQIGIRKWMNNVPDMSRPGRDYLKIGQIMETL